MVNNMAAHSFVAKKTSISIFVILYLCMFVSPIRAENVYKIYGPILNSDSEQSVLLQKIPDSTNTCSVCRDGYLNKIKHFPKMAILYSGIKLQLGELIECTNKDEIKILPIGICSREAREAIAATTDSAESEPLTPQLKHKYAEEIMKSGLLPLKMGPGDTDADMALAGTIVEMNLGDIDEALRSLDALIQEQPNWKGALYTRATALSRVYPHDPDKLAEALKDIQKVTENSDDWMAFTRKAEIQLLQGNYLGAMAAVHSALVSVTTDRLMFISGILHLSLENYVAAERNFRNLLEEGSPWHLGAYHLLGVTLYYRGKLRNAVEVFKDVLRQRPNDTAATLCLGQAFSTLGNVGAAKVKFTTTLSLDPTNVQAKKFMARSLYDNGDVHAALQVYQDCMRDHPDDTQCEYGYALCHATLGSFYQAVKTTTKILVQRPDIRKSVKASPELLKAIYLREQSRYLHQHLDDPLSALNMDDHHDNQLKDAWVKGNYPTPGFVEQPSIQPNIPDVTLTELNNLSPQAYALLSRAFKIGSTMQVNTDGFTANWRLNLAMGLAAIHIAQYVDITWKSFRQNKAPDKALAWYDVFQIAVSYRRLVNPETPVFWLSELPDHTTASGHRMDISLIKGSSVNVRTMQYFHLVFKLLKTMLEHYASKGDPGFASLEGESDETQLCGNLLRLIRKTHEKQNAFLVSTQVQSLRENTQDYLEGVMVTLAEDRRKQVLFYLNIGSTDDRTSKYPMELRHTFVIVMFILYYYRRKQVLFYLNIGSTDDRTSKYHMELRHTFGQIQDIVKKAGSGKITDMDTLVTHILSLIYYFYNLVPLSRGSSVVAYTVAIGLLMSVDRENTGRIPPGKLLEFEAILSGSPDSFTLITKQWMAIKRIQSSVLSLPRVWEIFPTTRSLLEVLHVPPTF